MEIIKQNPRMAWRHYGEMMVLINPDDRNLHEINETATFIWNSLKEGGLDKEALLSRMMEEYSGTCDIFRPDLEAFLDQAVHTGIFLRESVEVSSGRSK